MDPAIINEIIILYYLININKNRIIPNARRITDAIRNADGIVQQRVYIARERKLLTTKSNYFIWNECLNVAMINIMII